MSRIGSCLALALAVSACARTPRDTLSRDVCNEAPSAAPTVTGNLEDAAERATHVVRGRVRWTGSVTDYDGEKRRELAYVIVDILDFHRGDAWSIDPRMRRSFPLLADHEALRSLGCRDGEAFFFFVVLPGPEDDPPDGGVPDPVFRAFGDRAVGVIAWAPETERERIAELLHRKP